MATIGEWWRKLRYRAEGDGLEQEIAFHIECRADDLRREGLTPEEALAQARREFGPRARIGEDSRAAWQFAWLERLTMALRYTLRTLRRNPLFTTAAVLSLALGIGANTAVFTLLDQLVLRLLPVREPERLVMIWTTGANLGKNLGNRNASYPMYQDFQRNGAAFESVFCTFSAPLAMGYAGSTERITGELVSGNYFQALGVRPAVGRVFSPEQDDRVYKGHPVVVLSHRYWVDRFGADPRVVGRKILLNGYPMEIVGVSAAGFAGLDPSHSPHVRIPMQMAPLMDPGRDDLGDRRSQWIQMFARLKPGYTVESARASLQPLLQSILREELAQPALRYASGYERAQFLKRRVQMETAAAGYSETRRQYGSALVVLMAMAGLIMLVACSNVAGLLLARAAARQKEIAVRMAIGAGRRTLILHLLLESVVLSLAGAAVGLALSVIATRALLAMLPADGALLALKPDPDWRVLLFSVGIALATGLVFGLLPAVQATRAGWWRTGASARLRKSLVAVQVALSFLLLAGAGLFARTLINLRTAPSGFANLGQLATFRVDPARNGYPVPRMRAFYNETLRRIRAAPGVRTAAFTMVPLLHGNQWDSLMSVEGHQSRDGEDMQAYYNAVSPGYWAVMGIPLPAGRDFDQRDQFDPSAGFKMPTVAIVNRKFAEHFFGGRSPLGRHLGFGSGPETKLEIEIIGVVENSLYAGPRSKIERQVFLPFLEANVPLAATYYVRAAAAPGSILPLLRKTVAEVDRTVPVYEVTTLAQQLQETLSTERLIAFLSVVFGGLATVLAALGIYGVMSFTVARRTREIGLRMALGARQGNVLWLVLREVLVLLAAGLAVGVPCAWVLSSYVASQLYGVKPADMGVGAAALVLLAGVAVLAGLVPARRASTIDPMSALRCE